jgi:hypothetical protein
MAMSCFIQAPLIVMRPLGGMCAVGIAEGRSSLKDSKPRKNLLRTGIAAK